MLDATGGALWCSADAHTWIGEAVLLLSRRSRRDRGGSLSAQPINGSIIGARRTLDATGGASLCLANAHKRIGGAVLVLGRYSQIDRGSSLGTQPIKGSGIGAWLTLTATGGALRCLADAHTWIGEAVLVLDQCTQGDKEQLATGEASW